MKSITRSGDKLITCGAEIGKLGYEVKLVPPSCVEPFVKRQKNRAADRRRSAATRPSAQSLVTDCQIDLHHTLELRDRRRVGTLLLQTTTDH